MYIFIEIWNLTIPKFESSFQFTCSIYFMRVTPSCFYNSGNFIRRSLLALANDTLKKQSNILENFIKNFNHHEINRFIKPSITCQHKSKEYKKLRVFRKSLTKNLGRSTGIKIDRSSRSQMFFKTGVLKYIAIFAGKHLRWSLYLTKLQASFLCNSSGGWFWFK